MLALARPWRDLIRDGVVKDQAAIARLVGASRARVAQVMDLLYLAPDIQEEILFPGRMERRSGSIRHMAFARLAVEPLWVEPRRHWTSIATGKECAVPLKGVRRLTRTPAGISVR